MENTKNSFLEEEIFYYSPTSNFGVCAKNIKTQRNIRMSFTPFSSNQKISFCNTIMIPFIISEESIDNEKNIINQTVSNFQNEKSKISIRKDNTRMKTESSRDEKNNISCDKQVTRILIPNEIDKIEENTNEIEFTNLDYNENKDSLEINPYFQGSNLNIDITKYQNNSEIEKKKVNKILNKNKIKPHKGISNNNINNISTSKNLRKTISIDNKLSSKMKRIRSMNLNNLEKPINTEKEISENKIRKKKNKFRTSPNNEILKKNTKDKTSNNSLHNKENKDNKENKVKPHRKKRENTVVNKSSEIKIKDYNIKIYKTSLFNKNSSSNMETKIDPNLIMKDEKEKINKRKKVIKYNGLSHKLLLNFGLNNKDENKMNKEKTEKKEKKEKREKREKKEKKENNRKKEAQNKEQEINHNSTIRSNKKKNSLSFLNSQIKKVKTLTKEFNMGEKRRIQKTFRKKITDNLDFESALRNKNNLGKTQYNLFSPDKFTNTEFCGSDYLEYTLDCMDLILKKNTSQKQSKNKVNFNFPKTRGNKKKKIALFDLDETLVHCTGDIRLQNEPYQYSIDITLPGNKEAKVGINIRPFWKKTLNLIRKYYHIVIFTASHQAYADAVLNFMDPSNKYFKYRLYRNNCSLVDIDDNKFYVKDLDIFDEAYDLKDIIIVDNSVLSFIYHLENGIPIVPYYNEDKDGSLYVVGLYLMHIYKENDLREANKKYINLESFLNEAKTRNEIEEPIEEESTIKGNNDDINKEEGDITPEKIIERKKHTNTDKKKKLSFGGKIEQKRCSFSIDSPQHKLIWKSKLYNMYYEINYNKPLTDDKVTMIEEKSNKSFSVDSEEKSVQQDKQSDKNTAEFFFQKRLLTSVEKPTVIKRNSRSNKTIRNFVNLKTIRSNFYNKFLEDGAIK